MAIPAKKQLRLLFWKDYLRRKRNPILQATVFAWGVAVFLTLYVVRVTVEPEKSPTCFYKARALPSAGLLPFLQNFICNIDNKCEQLYNSNGSVSIDDMRNSRALMELQDIVSESRFKSFVHSLPSMVKLVDPLYELINPLDEDGIQIEDFLQDPNQIKVDLVNNSIMKADEVDVLLKSTVNVQYILNKLKTLDPKAIICDAGKLRKFFQSNTTNFVVELSKTLCNLKPQQNEKLIKNIFAELQLKEVSETVGKTIDRLGEYDMFEDLKNISRTILTLTNVKAYLPEYLKLDEWVPDIIPLFKTIKRDRFDREFVESSLNVVEAIFNKTEQWPLVKGAIKKLSDLIYWFERKAPLKKDKFKVFFPNLSANDSLTQIFNKFEKHTAAYNAERKSYILSDFLDLIAEESFHTFRLFLTDKTEDPTKIFTEFLDLITPLLSRPLRDYAIGIANAFNNLLYFSHNSLRLSSELERVVDGYKMNRNEILSELLKENGETYKELKKCFSDIDCINSYFKFLSNEVCDIALVPFGKTLSQEAASKLCGSSFAELQRRVVQDLKLSDLRSNILSKNDFSNNETSLDVWSERNWTTLLTMGREFFSSNETLTNLDLINSPHYLFMLQLSFLKEANATELEPTVKISATVIDEITTNIDVIPIFYNNVSLTVADSLVRTQRDTFCTISKSKVAAVFCDTFKSLKDELVLNFGSLVTNIIFSKNSAGLDWNWAAQTYSNAFMIIHQFTPASGNKVPYDDILQRIISFFDLSTVSQMGENFIYFLLRMDEFEGFDFNSNSTWIQAYENEVNATRLISCLTNSLEDSEGNPFILSLADDLPALSREILKLNKDLLKKDEMVKWLKDPCKNSWNPGVSPEGRKVLTSVEKLFCSSNSCSDASTNTTKNYMNWNFLIENSSQGLTRAKATQNLLLFKKSLRSLLLEKTHFFNDHKTLKDLSRDITAYNCLNNATKLCKELKFLVVKSSFKYATMLAQSFLENIEDYIAEISDANATIIQVMGYSKFSGLEVLRSKMWDFIHLFIDNYKSPRFEKEILAKKLKGESVECSQIIKHMKIPANNSVIESDVNDVAQYICPSIVNWPFLEKNLILQPLLDGQKVYFNEPVKNLAYTDWIELLKRIEKLPGNLKAISKRVDEISTALKNEDWVTGLKKFTLEKLSKYSFTSENSLIKFFKYIDMNDRPNVTFSSTLLNSGFGSLTRARKFFAEKFKDYSYTTPNNPDSETLIELIDVYPREVAGIFTYAAFLYPEEPFKNFWDNLHELCDPSAVYSISGTEKLPMPDWMASDEDEVLKTLCTVNFENIKEDIFSIDNLVGTSIRNFNMEGIFIDVLNRALQLNFPVMVHVPFSYLKLLWNPIVNGTIPSELESRKHAEDVSKNIIADNSDNVEKLKSISNDILFSKLYFDVLKGGDWWEKMMAEARKIKSVELREFILSMDQITILPILMGNFLSTPHEVYNIVKNVVGGTVGKLCQSDMQTGEKNLIYATKHLICANVYRSNPFEIDSATLVRNGDEAQPTVDKTVFSDNFYHAERNLAGLFSNQTQPFVLPNWLNQSHIQAKYQAYNKENLEPIVLLETSITVLTEVLDVTSIFYLNITNCPWCKWTVILAETAAKNFASINSYVEIMCEAPHIEEVEMYKKIARVLNLKELAEKIFSDKAYTVTDVRDKLNDLVMTIREHIFRFYTNNELVKKSEKCLEGFLKLPLFKDAKSFVQLIEVLLEKGDFLGMKDQTQNGRVKNIISSLLPARKISKPLSSIILASRPDDKLVQDLIRLSVNVDVNLVRSIVTEQDVMPFLENLDKFRTLFMFPNQADAEELFAKIKADPVTFSRNFLASIDRIRVMQELHSDLSPEFLQNLLSHLRIAFNHAKDIFDVVFKLDFDNILKSLSRTPELVDGILNIINGKTPKQFFNTLRQIVDDLSEVLPNESVHKDLISLIDRVEGLQIVRNIDSLDLKIKTKRLFKDEAKLTDFLTKEVELEPRFVEEVKEGSTDILAIIITQKELLEIMGTFCDPANVTQLLHFHNGEEEIGRNTTSSLCKKDPKELKSITSVLFKDFDVTDLFGNLIESVVRKLLDRTDLPASYGVQLLDHLSYIKDQIPKLKGTFGGVFGEFKALSLPTNQLNGDVRSLVEKAPKLLAKISKTICGRSLVQNTNKFIRAVAETQDFQKDYDQAELNSLPTPFCRDIYKTLVNMNGGKIIWSYMKPMIRGQILYAPMDEITLNVVKMANGSFEDASSLKTMIASIQTALNGLEGSEHFGQALQLLTKAMSLPLASIFLQTDVGSGMGSENIDGLVSDLKNINPLLDTAVKFFDCILLDRFVGMKSEAALEKRANELIKTKEYIAGVVFNTPRRFRRSVPSQSELSYKIRMDIDNVPSTKRKKHWFWAPGPEADFLDDMRYFRGFVQLQDMVENAIINMKVDEPQPSRNVYTQQMPYPCWTEDFFKSSLHISQTFQVCFFFGLMIIIAASVRFTVWEKESGNKMLMSVMGLRSFVHNVTWFTTSMLEMAVFMFFVLLVLKFGRVITETNPFILYMHLLNFGFATVMFNYMMSALFKSASLSAVSSVIIYMSTFLPYIIIISLEATLSYLATGLVNIFMSTSFCYGCLYIVRYEVQGTGLQWNNIWTSPVPDDFMSFATNFIFVFIDGIIYCLIGLLVNKYFGCPYAKNVTLKSIEIDSPNKIGVCIKNLNKIFRTRKGPLVALKDINVEMYTGQVTTLLGHNGAGKTTLIKILTRMMKPTSGEIVIDAWNHREGYSYLGVCPQRSVLFPELSAREHLMMYAQLKTSLPPNAVVSQVEEMLDSLELGTLAEEPTRVLSEGMRRRLCVAIAFVGAPGLVVLDEPSSGVDPVARRQLWNLIARFKAGRTVLLTTHHLDEAQLLSDRIVILHKGEILQTGTPLSLKMNQGYGYQFILTYSSQSNGLTKDYVPALSGIVNKTVSNASIRNIERGVITICVPYHKSSGSVNNFELLARTLEENQEKLGFTSLKVNSQTLEKVFTEICEQADSFKEKSSDDQNNSETKLNANNFHSKLMKDSHVQHMNLKSKNSGQTGSNITKCLALLKKRFIHYVQDYQILVCALVLPAVFTAIAMGFSLVRPPNYDDPSLKLTPALYQPHIVDFMSANLSANNAYQQRVTENLIKNSYYNRTTSYERINRECSCTSGSQICKRPSKNIRDSIAKLPSTKDVMQWTVETEDEYIERRYGGWSMDEDSHRNSTDMTVWFNNKGHHSMPSYLNSLNNAILQASRPNERITVYNHPIRLSSEQLSKSSVIQHIADVGIAVVILIAFSLVPASCSVYLVQERVNEEKRLQYLSGVRPTLYWAVTLLWDLMIFLIAVLLAAIVFKIFGLPVYVARDNLPAIVLLLCLFGWACIPFVHVAQRLFNDSSMSNMIFFCGTTFFGCSLLVCILLIDILGTSKFAENMRAVLHDIFLIFPPFTLGDGLVEISKNNIQADILQRFNIDAYKSPLDWDLMGMHYLSLALVGLVMVMITFIVEGQLLQKKHKKITKTDDKNSLDITGLRKEFDGVDGVRVAVDSLDLKVPVGHCVGLVGINGAGKSTTFKMLTGEIQPTAGKIVINNYEIGRRPLCSGDIGYCPQKDALDPKLTVMQSLEFYSKLRGCYHKNLIEHLLMEFNLQNHAYKKTENLSGGNKRKLCAAISVLGDSNIILMDEPTSGMDPNSRILISEAIQKVLQMQKSVVLTSHSMEECETLCSYVAIMVNGKIACQGLPQELKEKYGSGYLVSVRLRRPEQQGELNRLMLKYFPESELQNHEDCSSQYLLPAENLKASDIFKGLNAIKEITDLEEYCIEQSSLDQVFINVASMAKPDSRIMVSDDQLPNSARDSNIIFLGRL